MLALISALSAFSSAQPPAPTSPQVPIPDPQLFFPFTSVWSADLPGITVGAPAYDDTSAYVATANGQLIAISLADGKPRWTAEMTATGGPAIGDGLIFVPGSDAIEARAIKDGAVKWRTPIGGVVTAPVVWDTGWVIVGVTRHEDKDQRCDEVIALRAADGSVVWRELLEAPLRSRVALAGDSLYVPLDDGHVIAFTLKTGAITWKYKAGGAMADVLAVDERIYIGSKDNWFYCLDAATGGKHWAQRTGADVIGTPVVDDSNVYFVSLDNVVRALKRSNGTIAWLQPLPVRPAGGPLIVDDVVLIAGRSVNVRAFLRRDGHPVGEYSAPADLKALPRYFARVPGQRAAPLLVLLLVDESDVWHLEAMTSELPVI